MNLSFQPVKKKNLKFTQQKEQKFAHASHPQTKKQKKNHKHKFLCVYAVCIENFYFEQFLNIFLFFFFDAGKKKNGIRTNLLTDESKESTEILFESIKMFSGFIFFFVI